MQRDLGLVVAKYVLGRRNSHHLEETCKEKLNGELNGELNKRQQLVYKKIIANPGINANELVNKLAIPFSTIDKYIRIFLKKNIIERRGSKKTGGYYTL